VCRDRLAKAAAEPAAGRARAQVRTAYEVLSDPLLRALYDTKLSAGGRSGDLDDDAAAAGANGARARRSRAPPTLRPCSLQGLIWPSPLFPTPHCSLLQAGQRAHPSSTARAFAGAIKVVRKSPRTHCGGVRRGNRGAGGAAGMPSDGGADEPMEAEEAFAQRQREAAVVAHKDGRTAFWAGAQTLGFPTRAHRLLGRCAHHADMVRQREIASVRPAMHTGGRCARARRLRCAASARPAWLPPVWWLQPSMAAAACVAPASCLPVAPLCPGVQARGQQPPSAERPAPACAPSGARTRREGDAWARARAGDARAAVEHFTTAIRAFRSAQSAPDPDCDAAAATGQTFLERCRAHISLSQARASRMPCGPGAPANHCSMCPWAIKTPEGEPSMQTALARGSALCRRSLP